LTSVDRHWEELAVLLDRRAEMIAIRRTRASSSQHSSAAGLSLPRATLLGVSPRDDKADLTALAVSVEAEPARLDVLRATGDRLALDARGAPALRWRLAVVRALIVLAPDDDSVREAYGELVDRYRDDSTALATIKPLGDEIRRLETAGKLPSTLVVRSERRKRGSR
jgi:hypothetical protein